MLLIETKLLSKLSRNSYGSRQIAKNLQAKGYKVGRYRARTLMHKAGIVCRQRRRYRVTTISKHSLPIAKNILNRQFSVLKPNRVWVAEQSYGRCRRLHSTLGYITPLQYEQNVGNQAS